MGAKNCHISGPSRFPKKEFDTTLGDMLPMAPDTQRASEIVKIISFEGSREDPSGMTILLMKRAIKLLIRTLLTTIGVPLYRDTPVEGPGQRPKAFLNFGKVHTP